MVKIMENPIKMDDLGVPPFMETPIYVCIYHVISKKNMSKRCQKDLGDELYGIAKAHSQTQCLPVLDASLFKTNRETNQV